MSRDIVIAGLDPAIHRFRKKMDARLKVYARAGRRPDPGAGHDGWKGTAT
jgi:hypothetical protein